MPHKKRNCNKMIISSALVLAAVARSAAFSPSASGELAPSFRQPHQPTRVVSSLSYANADGDGNFISPELQRSANARFPERVPRRAMPHVKNASQTEDAIRAGYIIPHSQAMWRGTGASDSMNNRQQRPAQGGVRPLRTIRRIVHRSCQEHPSHGLPQEELSQIGIQAPYSSLDVNVRNKSSKGRSRLSLSRQPQLDEFLDRPEQLPPDEEQREGARRVTFKATREASISMTSKPVATLKEYMTQPVSQYSLLSFYDAKGSNNSELMDSDQSKSRRWIVRRLTTEEAQRYMSIASLEDDTVVDESNLFRLAVPLLPLIGWDLTPVIDLEVIPPEKNPVVGERRPSVDDADESSSSNWAPLKNIRRRMGDSGNEANCNDDVEHPPVVRIRSLRVSLLSTQEEVKAVMSNNNGRPNNRRDSNMQKEALEMVGKVEESLRPHISFEAELSWEDHSDLAPSTVSVKSTAVTSLTIPKLPSGILRKTVPSSFLVKRLGATLTSRALAICLPRFLRQLEKDYGRWSGIERVKTVSTKMVTDDS